MISVRQLARVVVVGIVSVALMTAFGVSSLAEENLSSGRGFGIGASLSLPPWPYAVYCISDVLSLQATGMILPGGAFISTSLHYRVLDGRALDLLAYLGLGIAVSGLYSGFGYAAISAGVALEYSLSKHLAVVGSVGLSYALSGGVGVLPTYGVKLTYYF
jgi:hypothetical protein